MTLFGKKEKEENEEKALAIKPPPVPKSAPKLAAKEEAQDTTYFGKNLKITGNVSGAGNLIILGSFDGEFALKGQVKVAQGATVKGNVKATSISVNGNVEGTIAASENIRLDNTARIKGRIVAPKISVLEGAVFDGEVQMTSRSAQASKPSTPGPAQMSKEPGVLEIK